ncbi:hypothetical protein [Oscillibacter sp.]|uniref:hypothetical protein n=1 Tax=Oscillibacter sp. TaxID=1945593 RepID=UPI002D802F2F|nr:hypothetical protein [Oscillibacter sp.]
MSGGSPKEIRFIDRFYNTLFMLPDGGRIIRTTLRGVQETLTCKYTGPCHALIGYQEYHICQFAEIQEHHGAVYVPEHPREGDICDTYSIYSPKYLFHQPDTPLSIADFKKVHAGVLAPNITLETIFFKHEQYTDINWIPRISSENVIVLNRGGKERAYCVDQPNRLELSFHEVKHFFGPPKRVKKRLEPER